MRQHVDVLGRLYLVWGAFGVLTGTSLAVLAVGARAALIDMGSLGRAERAAVWVFAVCASLLGGGGVITMIVGRAIRQRRPFARVAALALAAPNLVIVPFGTALGVYTFWVMLNDDARRTFGRPLRGSAVEEPMTREGL